MRCDMVLSSSERFDINAFEGENHSETKKQAGLNEGKSTSRWRERSKRGRKEKREEERRKKKRGMEKEQ